MHFIPQEVIRHKRDGKVLSKAEIDGMVQAITDCSASEGQVAAFAMAVFFQGMTLEERIHLTTAMKNSGTVLDWSEHGLASGVVDKHSTGGVGDKVSLILGPLAAACGAKNPMISGRGLGHTGGTLDKFEAIPGYNATPDLNTFARVVREVGCAIIGQTADLAPADRRLYGVRDVTATVESLDLITASILSKKLAAGLNGLVMDVKFGSGAFMQKHEDALELATSIATVATGAGVPTVALITDMNEVLGHSVGNSLEVIEAVEFLSGKNRDPRLMQVTLALTGEMLVLAGAAENRSQAISKMNSALASGAALEKFSAMVTALGGPEDFVKDPTKYLDVAPVTLDVIPDTGGYVSDMDCRAVGMVLVGMKGGRCRADECIDHGVGMTGFKNIGDKVGPGMPLCTIHARCEEQAAGAAKAVLATVNIASEQPRPAPVVFERITGE